MEDVDSSYSFVVSYDGKMLYHPTESKIGNQVENEVVAGLVEELMSGKIPESAIADYTYNGEKKYCSYYVDPEGVFIYVVAADKRDVLTGLQTVQRRVNIITSIVFVFSMVCFYLYAKRITKPIEELSKEMIRMSELDFADREELEKLAKSKNEIGDISKSVVLLKEKLRETVINLQQQSTILFDAAGSLNANTQETAATVEQLEQAVHDIAASSSEQASDTESANYSMTDIGAMIDATTEMIHILNGNMEQMGTSGSEATNTLMELKEINSKAQESIDLIYDQTNVTNESAQKINDAVSIIASIAEQTNLLSLNASIEASRAGEYGRGFSVVAAEIKSLAEQSCKSASEIEDIVASLMNDSQNAVSTMEDVKLIMEKQEQQVSATDDKFAMVQKKLEDSIEEVIKIEKNAEEMDRSKNEVLGSIHNLSAAAEENAANTEETSASLAEVSTIVSEIAVSVGNLDQVANSLTEDINKFTLS